ncbi:hypothetical protein V7S43_011791 [Phytophthora oleae]|uniref:Peptidase M13 C-terminal domain-containing protein n=1 Tax=Phytophthora oleae TaxID=2107226 RepID=A0ABD3FCG0_9STRA
MIGHELTHGFNSTGREYDGEGNRANWWSNRSSEQFDERAQCFSSQYSNFAVDSANGSVLGHVNGDQTITENIADNGGLNLAFVAYQTYMRNVSLTGKSKLSTAEGEQLFFIAYGQSWCGKMDDNMMQYILSSDPHSLAKWRVNGAVMNNPDFAGVFKCKAGAKMNPKHKCEMW